jgi:hypothetical protein
MKSGKNSKSHGKKENKINQSIQDLLKQRQEEEELLNADTAEDEDMEDEEWEEEILEVGEDPRAYRYEELKRQGYGDEGYIQF